MNTLTLARFRSHKAAQAEVSRWIKMQKKIDSLFLRINGFHVEPAPHDVYFVRRDGKKWAVIFADPSA